MKLVSFDVETRGTEDGYGLQPFRVKTGEAWLTMCAFASKGSVKGIMRPHTEKLRGYLEHFAANGYTICGWNTPFDMAWLIAMGLRDEVYACKWLDGMLLWRHLTAAPEWSGLAPSSYSLKNAVATFYPDEAGYEKDINFETDDPEELSALLDYNKKDAAFTLRLVNKFWDEMTERQQRIALIESACLPMVAESYVDGIVANRDKAETLAQSLEETANIAMVKLKLSTTETIDDTILASPTKLRKLLYEDWGLPVPKLTKKDAASTDRDALSQLAPIDKRAGLLNEYRESKNNRTKFALGTVNSLDYNGDGRVRPNAKVYGTYTGRMTYGSKIGRGKSVRPTGVALHQWKRAKDFRDIIEVPEGYTLLEFDFSGQEFRWMAVMSGDRTMIQLCQPGEDAHSYMGARIGNQKYSALRSHIEQGDDPKAKELRQLGKVANLSLQYRTSAMTLQRVARVGYQLDISQQECKAIHATYRTTYPRVQDYWQRQITFAGANGFIETIAGRRVHVGTKDTWIGYRTIGYDNDEPITEPVDNKWGSESTAINFPIQGSGADQKYLALAVAKNYLPSVEGHFYFELHDGLFFIVPDRYAEKARVEIKAMLSNLPYKRAWNVDLPVDFPVDSKMGKTWGQLKEFK